MQSSWDVGGCGAGRMQNTVLEDGDGDQRGWVRTSSAQKCISSSLGIKPMNLNPSLKGSEFRRQLVCVSCSPVLSLTVITKTEEGILCKSLDQNPLSARTPSSPKPRLILLFFFWVLLRHCVKGSRWGEGFLGSRNPRGSPFESGCRLGRNKSSESWQGTEP